MLLEGEFYYKNEKIDFFSDITKNGIEVSIIKDGLVYPAEFFLINFRYIEKYYAFKQYYESELFNHLAKVYSGSSDKYMFKFFDSYVKINVSETETEGASIVRIIKIFMEYNDDLERYLVFAHLGCKTLKKTSKGKKYFVYSKLNILLGKYEDTETIEKAFSLLGQYVKLEDSFYIVESIAWKTNDCFEVDETGSVYQIMDTGLFHYKKNGIIENAQKEKMLFELESSLGKIIDKNLLKQLLEY